MTLSESQALDSFDFLGADDTALLHRMSRISFSEGYESPTFDDGTSKEVLYIEPPVEHIYICTVRVGSDICVLCGT